MGMTASPMTSMTAGSPYTTSALETMYMPHNRLGKLILFRVALVGVALVRVALVGVALVRVALDGVALVGVALVGVALDGVALVGVALVDQLWTG